MGDVFHLELRNYILEELIPLLFCRFIGMYDFPLEPEKRRNIHGSTE